MRPLSPPDIRPLAPADMAAVMRIQALCYSAITPESAGSMGAKRAAAPQACFGAWRGARLLGYLLAVPVRWPALPPLDHPVCEVPAQADTLYLHDLALSPQARGSGAGAALVAAALAAGRRLGLAGAALVAIQGSGPYWQRHGFAARAPVEPALAAKLASYGTDARLMRRAL